MGSPGEVFGGLDEPDDAEERGDGPFDGPSSPIALLVDMVRTLGPQGFRALMKTPGPMRDALRELERALGKGAFDRLVDTLAEEIDPSELPLLPPALFDDGPSPRARKRARAKRKRR
jgi:hypothetical protein